MTTDAAEFPGNAATHATLRESPCPCGLSQSYAKCCGSYHAGIAQADSPERLMRSRYTAFAIGDAAYLLRTWHPSTRPKSLELDPALTWKRLLVESSTGGALGADRGTVTFTAIARDAEGRHLQREHSRFLREQGSWFYVDGDALDG